MHTYIYPCTREAACMCLPARRRLVLLPSMYANASFWQPSCEIYFISVQSMLLVHLYFSLNNDCTNDTCNV